MKTLVFAVISSFGALTVDAFAYQLKMEPPESLIVQVQGKKSESCADRCNRHCVGKGSPCLGRCIHNCKK